MTFYADQSLLSGRKQWSFIWWDDNESFSIMFCTLTLESCKSSNLMSSNVSNPGQFDQFHCNFAMAVSKLFQEIKMCPECLESSRISLYHNLQVAVAFFFGAKGRYENIMHHSPNLIWQTEVSHFNFFDYNRHIVLLQL